MSGEIEAAGALATATLAASALEPDSGQAGRHSQACLNCGAAVQGRFCHVCGQPAHVHRSMSHMFEEFLHGVVHFDSKAWRTLPLLLFRPGKLTRDYVYGRRARYISPLGIFLFTIFLMFFVFGFLHFAPKEQAVVIGPQSRAEAVQKLQEARQDLAAAQKELAEQKAEVARVKANPNPAPGEGAGLDATIAGIEFGLRSAEKEVARREKQLAEFDKPGGKTQSPEPKSWQDEIRNGIDSGDLDVNLGNDELEAKAKTALRNPDLLLYKVQQKAYKLSFLLVPMSLPFVWLLFAWKRGVKLYDHAVFVLYSLSFMSLLFVFISLLSLTALDITPLLGAFATLVPLVHN
jgi:hypothetical protein